LRPAQNLRILRTTSAVRSIMSTEEGHAALRALRLRSGMFLFLREDGAPAETVRLEPCPPGEFWQGNGPQRDLFLEKPPRGPWRRYGRKWPGFEKNPLYSLFSRSHRYHRARLLDCSVVPPGIFFRKLKTRGQSRMARSVHSQGERRGRLCPAWSSVHWCSVEARREPRPPENRNTQLRTALMLRCHRSCPPRGNGG
jgi:hypothetical protein